MYILSPRLMRLANLLAITSTVSAVSLQDFQAVTIVQVPSLSCLSAYGSTIHGCSRGDFLDGVQCSKNCAKGIKKDQENIRASCINVAVNAMSLLGLALQGELLDALCPSFQATSVTSSVVPITTQTFLTPSQSHETLTPTTSTSESESVITTSTITMSTSTSDSSEVPTTTQATTSMTDTTVASITSTEPGTTTSTPSTSTPSPTQTSSGQDDKPDRGRSGGGSPFDPVIVGDAVKILQVRTSVLRGLTGTLIVAFLIG
ncbi:hypothetical protein F4777DRAFT_408244 [Nemania sp. FL0916]|nr:hypothetical protein F4777DRAFT_408244 [Nemania sp. FL0916]